MVAIAAGIAVCAAFGLANGLLVTSIPLPPFIVTLGMLNIAFALTHIYSNEETIVGLPAALTGLGNTFRIGATDVTYGSIADDRAVPALRLSAQPDSVGQARLRDRQQPRGRPPDRHPDQAAAGRRVHDRRRGLRHRRAAAGGAHRRRRSEAGQTDNLDSITAVVLGGTSLFGGRGAVLGTLIGALIVGVFRNGLQLMGVPSIYQILITGILVILAVTVDQISRRRAS